MKSIIFAIVLMAGCATPQSPSQAVFAAKQQYAVALTAAVAYKNLPRCGTPQAIKVCSDAKVVSQLQKADDTAIAMLDGAEALVRTNGTNADLAITAANQAVSVLTTITKMIGAK